MIFWLEFKMIIDKLIRFCKNIIHNESIEIYSLSQNTIVKMMFLLIYFFILNFSVSSYQVDCDEDLQCNMLFDEDIYDSYHHISQFHDKSKTIQSTTFSRNVRSIGSYSFALLNTLSTVTFSSSVEYIGEYAFHHTSVGYIDLSNTQISILS